MDGATGAFWDMKDKMNRLALGLVELSGQHCGASALLWATIETSIFASARLTKGYRRLCFGRAPHMRNVAGENVSTEGKR
jgi:hypothetical protein